MSRPSEEATEAVARIFGEDYAWPWDEMAETSRERYREKARRAIGAIGARHPTPRFDPLGGAAHGVGRCSCAAGPGTNPACPVHP